MPFKYLIETRIAVMYVFMLNARFAEYKITFFDQIYLRFSDYRYDITQ